jgi:hypothetical protein
MTGSNQKSYLVNFTNPSALNANMNKMREDWLMLIIWKTATV